MLKLMGNKTFTMLQSKIVFVYEYPVKGCYISGQPMATSTPAFQAGRSSSPVAHISADTESYLPSYISGQPMATSTPAFQAGRSSSPVAHISADTESYLPSYISGQPMATSTPAFQAGHSSSPVAHISAETERVISPAPGTKGCGLMAEDNFGKQENKIIYSLSKYWDILQRLH